MRGEGGGKECSDALGRLGTVQLGLVKKLAAGQAEVGVCTTTMLHAEGRECLEQGIEQSIVRAIPTVGGVGLGCAWRRLLLLREHSHVEGIFLLPWVDPGNKGLVYRPSRVVCNIVHGNREKGHGWARHTYSARHVQCLQAYMGCVPSCISGSRLEAQGRRKYPPPPVHAPILDCRALLWRRKHQQRCLSPSQHAHNNALLFMASPVPVSLTAL